MRSRWVFVLLVLLVVLFVSGGWYGYRQKLHQSQQTSSKEVAEFEPLDAPAAEMVVTNASEEQGIPYGVSVLNALKLEESKLSEVQVQGETIPKLELSASYLKDGRPLKITMFVYHSVSVRRGKGQLKLTGVEDLDLQPGAFLNVGLFYVPKSGGDVASLEADCRRLGLEGCIRAFKGGFFRGKPVNVDEFLDQHVGSGSVVVLDPVYFIVSDLYL